MLFVDDLVTFHRLQLCNCKPECNIIRAPVPVQTVAKLGHTKGPITSLSFSENGYYLTSTAEDGVKLWDLRKLVCVREFNTDIAPSFVAFDHSGLYLAVGSDRVDIHAVKQDWSVVKTFTDMPKKVTHSPMPINSPQPHGLCPKPCCVLDSKYCLFLSRMARFAQSFPENLKASRRIESHSI